MSEYKPNESKSYTSVDEMIKHLDDRKNKEKRKNPIKYYLTKLWYKIENLWELPGNFCREIKYFYQRGTRGWSDKDWWSIDYFLCDIIPPMLIKLRKNKHGLPNKLVTKYENVFRGNKIENDINVALDEDINDMAMELAEKEYNNILDNIIFTFETAKKIGNTDLNLPFDGCEKLKEPDWKFLTKDEVKKYYKGFDLFKEYFHNLWD